LKVPPSIRSCDVDGFVELGNHFSSSSESFTG
jgi:hypothetical protein